MDPSPAKERRDQDDRTTHFDVSRLKLGYYPIPLFIDIDEINF